MKKHIFSKTLLVCTIVAFGTACDNNRSTDVNRDEYDSSQQGQLMADSFRNEEVKKFAMEAASDGMMEIQAAEIAMEKSGNQQIKELAGMIKSDHENANEKLKGIARNNNWELPKEPMEKHQEKLAELRNSSGGEAFDQQYLDMMENGHEEAIEKFEQHSSLAESSMSMRNQNAEEAERQESMPDSHVGNDVPKNEDRNTTGTAKSGNRELEAWADQTLPVLQKHLERVKELKGEVTNN